MARLSKTTLVMATLCLTMLGACTRDPAPMSLCNGDVPMVERIKDVGPPNCPKK